MAAGATGNRWPVRAPIDGVVPAPVRVQLDGANDPTFIHGMEFFNPTGGVQGPTTTGSTGLFKFNLWPVGGAQGYFGGLNFANGAEVFLAERIGRGIAVATAYGALATTNRVKAYPIGLESWVQGGYFYFVLIDTSLGTAVNPPAKAANNNIAIDVLIMGNEQNATGGTQPQSNWASRGPGV